MQHVENFDVYLYLNRFRCLTKGHAVGRTRYTRDNETIHASHELVQASTLGFGYCRANLRRASDDFFDHVFNLLVVHQRDAEDIVVQLRCKIASIS